MNFDLSDDQVALRDGIRSLLEGRFDSARVRQGFDRAMFEELVEAGVLTLREDGFGFADAAIIFEELGRAFVPGPLVWSLLARELDLPVGADGPAILSGFDAEPPFLVEHPDVIDGLLVIDRDRLGYVPAGDLALEAVDGAPLDALTPVARLAALPETTEVGGPDVAAVWRERGAVLTAAFCVGLAGRATELAVEHALTREQFGRVIGGFQAVKHMCADMAVRTELARVAVHAAAVHLDDPDLAEDRDERCRVIGGAKILAGEAAILNGRSSMQVHGGMGFTWEVDVHLLLKRAWVLDTHFGSVDRHAWEIVAG